MTGCKLSPVNGTLGISHRAVFIVTDLAENYRVAAWHDWPPCGFIPSIPTRQLSGAPEGHLSRTPGSPSRSAVTLFAAQLPRSPDRSEGER
jgi:hypothetical protein